MRVSSAASRVEKTPGAGRSSQATKVDAPCPEAIPATTRSTPWRPTGPCTTALTPWALVRNRARRSSCAGSGSSSRVSGGSWTGEAAGTAEAAGARRSTCVGPHAALDPFGQVTLLGCHPPQFEKHRGDADPDRADLLAGSAEGRRIRKIGPGTEPFQRGGEDRTHGPRVDGAVAVPADGPEDGA